MMLRLIFATALLVSGVAPIDVAFAGNNGFGIQLSIDPPKRLSTHRPSTPGAEQLPQAKFDPAAAAQTCAAKGLRFAGDISTATHGGTCMCPWGLRSGTIDNLASFRNQCI